MDVTESEEVSETVEEITLTNEEVETAAYKKMINEENVPSTASTDEKTE